MSAPRWHDRTNHNCRWAMGGNACTCPVPESTAVTVNRIFAAEMAKELKARFPWVGTDEDAESVADVIEHLALWYEDLKRRSAQ